MNSRSHWLSLFSAFIHLGIGLPELLRIGPRFLPPSWVIIYAVLPAGFDWLWPGLFALTGVIAILGTVWTWALRLGFRLSAVAFLVWGLVGVYAWSQGEGGTIPGALANIYLAGAAWVLARYVSIGVRATRINEQVAVLAEQVYQASEADVNG